MHDASLPFPFEAHMFEAHMFEVRVIERECLKLVAGS
jgi:hypothetical protein